MNLPSITTETPPNAADMAVLSEGLRSYGIMELGGVEPLALACFLRHQGSIVGGGCGRAVGTRFLLDLLWVHKHWRNKGHGRALLRAIEEQASLQGCRDIILETLNDQAVAFYMKSHYELIAQIQNFIPGFSKSALLKQIT